MSCNPAPRTRNARPRLIAAMRERFAEPLIALILNVGATPDPERAESLVEGRSATVFAQIKE